MNGLQRTPPNNNNNIPKCNNTKVYGAQSQKRQCRSPINSIMQDRESGNMQVVDVKTLERSLATLLDERMKNLATKSDLVEVKTKMDSLERSNVFLQSKLQQVENRCQVLERQIDFLEKKSNEKNLVLHIPTQDDDQHVIEKTKSVCLDLLQENNPSKIVKTKVIRSRNKRVANVIVEMQHSEDVSRILRSAIKLRDTGISIHRDYTRAARDKRRRILQIKTNIQTYNKNMKVTIRGQTLICENKSFYLDHNNMLKCETDDEIGMTLMNKILTACSDSNNLTETAQSTNNVGNTVHVPTTSAAVGSVNCSI